MGLDTNQANPGYLCGRLLAVLEALEVAVIPDDQRTIFYNLLPQAIQSPGLAITLVATRSPAWLAKLATRDRAAADLHKMRIGGILAHIPSPDVPVDVETQSWATLGYSHQEAADIAAGLRPDQDHLISTDEVGELLRYSGDNAAKTATSWLSRHGLKPVGRQAGRDGQNVWSYAQVMAARAAAPGRGARTDKNLKVVVDTTAAKP